MLLTLLWHITELLLSKIMVIVVAAAATIPQHSAGVGVRLMVVVVGGSVLDTTSGLLVDALAKRGHVEAARLQVTERMAVPLVCVSSTSLTAAHIPHTKI